VGVWLSSNITRKFTLGRLKPMASMGAQAYNGSLEVEPQWGPRAEPLVRGVRRS